MANASPRTKVAVELDVGANPKGSASVRTPTGAAASQPVAAGSPVSGRDPARTGLGRAGHEYLPRSGSPRTDRDRDRSIREHDDDRCAIHVRRETPLGPGAGIDRQRQDQSATGPLDRRSRRRTGTPLDRPRGNRRSGTTERIVRDPQNEPRRGPGLGRTAVSTAGRRPTAGPELGAGPIAELRRRYRVPRIRRPGPGDLRRGDHRQTSRISGHQPHRPVRAPVIRTR